MHHFLAALRSALFYLATAITVVLFTTALFIFLPLPFRYGRKQISRTWAKLIMHLGSLICGMKVKFVGLEHCPSTPAVYLLKHQSAWETMTLLGVLPPNCAVAKESLLNIPLFGWSMRMAKAIPINRTAGMGAFKKIIALGKNRITEGLSILIFPEGTRVPPGEHPRFHKTAAILAKEAGVPVVPVAHNSGSCWRRNSFLKYPGLITVVIGKPIDSQSMSSSALNNMVYEWIKTEMIKLEGSTP